MKKILTILFALMLLVGCSSSSAGYSKVSDDPDMIFTYGNGYYSAGDLYKTLKLQSGAVIENSILETIAAKYEVDIDGIKNDADELIEMYTSIGYESMIISYYGSIEAYRSTVISSAIIDALGQQMVKDNLDSYVNEDKPVKMQYASFSTLEEAQKLVDMVNSGSSFDMAVLSVDENANPQSLIYTDKSEMNYVVKEYINSTDTTGLSTILTSDTVSKDENGNDVTTSEFFVLNIISRNVEDFNEEYIDTAVSSLEADDIINYFFTKHDIKFYDQDLYELMTKNYEVLK